MLIFQLILTFVLTHFTSQAKAIDTAAIVIGGLPVRRSIASMFDAICKARFWTK